MIAWPVDSGRKCRLSRRRPAGDRPEGVRKGSRSDRSHAGGRRSALPAATIEDVVQNTLIKAIRKLGHFRPESSLFTWLCQICHFELVDLHRKSARRDEHDMQHQALATETFLHLRGEPRIRCSCSRRASTVVPSPERSTICRNAIRRRWSGNMAMASVCRRSHRCSVFRRLPHGPCYSERGTHFESLGIGSPSCDQRSPTARSL